MSRLSTLAAFAAIAVSANPGLLAAMPAPVAPRRPSLSLAPTSTDLGRLAAAEAKRARRAARRLRGAP